jgi:hypothetical protein
VPSHAGQVEGGDQDDKGCPGPPGLELGVRLTSPRKNVDVEKISEMRKRELIHTRKRIRLLLH